MTLTGWYGTNYLLDSVGHGVCHCVMLHLPRKQEERFDTGHKHLWQNMMSSPLSASRSGLPKGDRAVKGEVLVFTGSLMEATIKVYILKTTVFACFSLVLIIHFCCDAVCSPLLDLIVVFWCEQIAQTISWNMCPPLSSSVGPSPIDA